MCKLHTFVFVFIALDNSRVHMCLYVVVAQIMLLLFNQTEWILMYYQGSLLSYGMCVCLLRRVCLLCFFFFFCRQMRGFETTALPPPPFLWVRDCVWVRARARVSVRAAGLSVSSYNYEFVFWGSRDAETQLVVHSSNQWALIMAHITWAVKKKTKKTQQRNSTLLFCKSSI